MLRGIKKRFDWLFRNIVFVTKNASIENVSICVEMCASCFCFIIILLFITANYINACSHETSNAMKVTY